MSTSFWILAILHCIQEMVNMMKKDTVCIHAFILRGGIWLLSLFVI
uniref:Uncharacterized protein n=1 Tax=Arundo donax TaxID=35708 RepID=A0A0A9GTV6_ARUDO